MPLPLNANVDDPDADGPPSGSDGGTDEPARGGPVGGLGDPGAAEPSVNPALLAAAAALAAAGVPWALLRGAAGAAEDEVDLVVPARRLAAFGAAIGAAGFARWPAIGHGRHRFFRAYDASVDRWLTLDVVDELAFGSAGALGLPIDLEALVGRRTDGPLPSLDPDDAFWSLLLHDLLDRRDLPPHHAERLTGFRAAASPDAALGSAIDAAAGGGTAAALLAAFDRGDEPAARRRARSLARALARRAPLTFGWRRLAGAIGSRLRKPHAALTRRGIDVAILGPDGAGKSTLAVALCEALPIPTRTIYLGLYGAGRRAPRRLGLVARLSWLWRGWLAGTWHRLRGRIVVYDRHALDAAGSPARSARRRLRRWLLLHAIPAPALLIVLDAPGAALHDRKGEHDPETLDAMRAAYRRLAASRGDAVVLDATGDRDAVRRAATAAIWTRWSRGHRP